MGTWSKNTAGVWTHSGLGRGVLIADSPFPSESALKLQLTDYTHQVRGVVLSSGDGRSCFEVGCVVDALELIGMNIDGARYASADEQRILDLIRPRLAALNDLDGEGDPEKTVELVRVVMPALDPPAVKPVRSGMKADSLELQNGNGSNRSNENDVASGPTVRAGKQR